MAARSNTALTPEQYLAIERASDAKSEYINGEMFLMAGASEAHNMLVGNIVALLNQQLRTRECRVYPSDMRVHIRALGKYTYPDVSVVCGEREFEDELSDILLNPGIIFEVLSESTEAYDRGKKFEHYQLIDSLSEYLLVAQDAVRIEQYVRQDHQTWRYREYHDKDETVFWESIDCSLPLPEVYLKLFDR